MHSHTQTQEQLIINIIVQIFQFNAENIIKEQEFIRDFKQLIVPFCPFVCCWVMNDEFWLYSTR